MQQKLMHIHVFQMFSFCGMTVHNRHSVPLDKHLSPWPYKRLFPVDEFHLLDLSAIAANTCFMSTIFKVLCNNRIDPIITSIKKNSCKIAAAMICQQISLTISHADQFTHLNRKSIYDRYLAFSSTILSN